MANSPLIRPYLLGGVALRGDTLGSHEDEGMIGMILWKKVVCL